MFKKIGTFFQKIETDLANDVSKLENTMKAIGNWICKTETKVIVIMQEVAKDYKLLLAAEQSPAVQAAIKAVESLLLELAAEL